MRRISLIAVSLAGMWAAGCTSIQTSHYLSPAAPGGSLERHPLSPDVAAMLSGPANSLRLETNSLRLGFACWNEGYTPLLTGPFVFPIFPIALLYPVVRKPLDTLRLEIAIHIEPIDELITFTPGKVTVVDAVGNPLQLREIRSGPGRSQRISDNAYVPPERELSAEDTATVSKLTLFVLQFEAANGDEGSSFRVMIKGVSRSGSNVSLPAIELVVASGLELQMGP